MSKTPFALAVTLSLVTLAAESAPKPQASAQAGRIAMTRDNLVAAGLQGDVQTVKLLLDGGVDPNAPDPEMPRSVLSLVAVTSCQLKKDAQGRDGVIAALLAGGADPNAMEAGGVPVFVSVAQQCPRPVVEAFVKAGARLDIRSAQGFTPLSMALIVQNLDAAEALVDLGARLSPEAARKLYPEPPAEPRLAKLVQRATGRAAGRAN